MVCSVSSFEGSKSFCLSFSQIQENGKKSVASFLKRFKFSVITEKTIFVCNLTVITSGIAYGFFIRLPVIMLGFSTYGIFYLLMHSKVKQLHPGKVDYLQKILTEKNEKITELQNKLEEVIGSDELSKNISEQIEQDKIQLEGLLQKRQRSLQEYKKEKQKLKKEINLLELKVQNLQREVEDYEKARRRR